MDLSAEPLSVRRRGGRRRWRTALAALVGVAAAVLALTVVLQLVAPTPSWRLTWARYSLALSALLLTLLVGEIARRMRLERMWGRADRTLRPIIPSSGEVPVVEANDSRSSLRLLEDLTACVAAAMGAAWAVLELAREGLPEGTTRVTSGVGAPEEPADEEPTTDPAAPRLVPTSSTRAAPADARLRIDLVHEGAHIGTLEVGAAAGHSFRRIDHMLLRHVGERVSGQIERAHLADAERRSRLEAEQARRQVNVLARAAVPLAPALENPEDAVAELGDVVVPDFADLFAVDLVRDDGRLERIITAHQGSVPSLPDYRERGARWAEVLQRVMAEGRSELAFTGGGSPQRHHDTHLAVLHELQLQSWVVAPIRVRGLSLGTVTLATRDGRRGYRPSDQVTIDDLAARCSIAFERGLLYREARQAAEDASQRANQLARLVETTITLTPTLERALLPQALAEQAAYVLQAPYASARFDDDAIPVEHGARPEDPMRVTGSLYDGAGRSVGHLVVERASGSPFGYDDDAVLTMLARLASVVSQNARLYQDARNREHRLQALIEASPLAILELDSAGVVQVANPAARTLFPVSGADRTELVSLPAELLDRLMLLAPRNVRGERGEAELTTKDPTGERRNLWVSTAPVSEGASATRMLAVITDMTTRKRLEEQLAKAQRFEAIGNLAGGVAHDFNNLLTVIMGYGEMLLAQLAEGSPARDQVEAIIEAGNHAAVITNQMLTLSRHQVLQPESIEPAARCTALLPMLRRLAGDSVAIRVHREGSARISVDPGQLEQVLFNLVLNARDAMAAGGSLMIEVGRRVRDGGEGNEMVSVRVTDDGEGMDADTLTQCQEPFFTTKGRGRGTGLGLATVASILERSGGKLEMASEPGRGTSATVLFPLVVDGDRTAPAPHDRQPARVLLVDDDDQVRRFATSVLGQGYVVTAVGDGESAIRRAETDGAFDLVISDVVLPAMSGFDVVRTMLARWPLTPCVLITGYARSDALETDLATTTLVHKPFTPEELLRAAAAALRREDQGSKR
ncbi:MAG: ATP-binding protein [Acidimicrobiales bacterium]